MLLHNFMGVYSEKLSRELSLVMLQLGLNSKGVPIKLDAGVMFSLSFSTRKAEPATMTTHLMRSRILCLFLGAGLCLFSVQKLYAAAPDFSHEIVPILKKHCVECHGGKEAKGGFSLNHRSLFLEGEAAIPGNVQESYFLELITSTDPELQMPPKGKERVSEQEIKLLQQWVASGMLWQQGFSFSEKTYEIPLKPRRPELPPVQQGRENPVDRIIDAYFAKQKLKHPAPISDDVFIRRVTLDLVGLLPTPKQRAEFLADQSADKRTKYIQTLLGDDIAYADHWLTFWNDLLRNDYTGTGFITGGRTQISKWLYAALVNNMPYDQFTRELIAPPTPESSGFINGIKWRGDVSAGQTVEIQFAQSLSQTFLGINMKCASCHDSFVSNWKLSEAYGLAAIYGNKEIEIYRCDKPTGEKAAPSWLFPELGQIDPKASQPERLKQLANLMTHPQNGRFARTIVNRLWHRLMGHGIVHPVDALETEPWNKDLLDYLAVYLVDQKYDLKKVLELITTSRAYQSRSEVVSEEAEYEQYVFAGPRTKRMTAEQFMDSLWQITGAAPVKIDAPVLRAKVSLEEAMKIELKGSWVWGDSAADGKTPPAGETIAIRKIVTIDENVSQAVAVVTCDNDFTLFINGREISRGNNWQQPVGLVLNGKLRKGKNQIVAVAHNAGDKPNPAGFYFEARAKLASGKEIEIVSDSSWQFNPSKVNFRESRLGGIPGEWKSVTIVPTLPVWSDSTQLTIRTIIAQGTSGQMPMIRTSLVKSDFLMRSLGRPNRDQIVSSRPDELTTLEAIDLANGETLSQALTHGAKNFAGNSWKKTSEMIQYVFQFALSREPTSAELKVLHEALGDSPSVEQIQDMLWAVCMTPEFLLIR